MGKPFEITNNIRKLRFFADEMTQQQLAEKAGLELAFRIAHAFGVTIGEVFECRVKPAE